MAVSKVVYGTSVLVDLTEDSVSAETMLKGASAHNAAGELVVGAYVPAKIETGTVTLSSNSRTINVTGSFVPEHIVLYVDSDAGVTSGTIRMAMSLDMATVSCNALTAASLAIGIASTVNTSTTTGSIAKSGNTITFDSGSSSRTFVKGIWRYVIWRDAALE